MLKFKSPTGDIVEVTEEFANQVLIPQGKYTLVKKASVVAPVKSISKKKAKKKVK